MSVACANEHESGEGANDTADESGRVDFENVHSREQIARERAYECTRNTDESCREENEWLPARQDGLRHEGHEEAECNPGQSQNEHRGLLRFIASLREKSNAEASMHTSVWAPEARSLCHG
jgi:hypothetical protein